MNGIDRREKRIRIGKWLIGEEEPCFIIAEAGANHNRDLGMAKALIDVAAEAGCNAVKFQTYSANTLYSRKTPHFTYLGNQNVYELIRQCELPRAWQRELYEYAQTRSILFLSSPFDIRAIDELYEIGIEAFKIASFELVDTTLIQHAASKGKPLILSTGMANLGEIEEAIQIAVNTGNDQIILLHCNSLYPTLPENVNLRAMITMKHAFPYPVGFSDHTIGTTIPIAAVAMGAHVIEKHFTLSRNLSGPDHGPFALEPEELKMMVHQIRNVEKSFGDGIKRRSIAEEEMVQKGRRSVIAARDIPQGTKITRDMIMIKRPGTGISPKYVDLIVGREAKQHIQEDDPITWDMI
ncbi:N-acylneuraminate-9-phosphate synthase [Collibacillus ludicampi]|uniref:N-acylneuraminate-9-phosphate synthase n=1 Tax=Collibacillus ludicampi TaxID=2771369 RepID=A0AAV4LG44_9BACL|nr:N-acetylneuraminate synthase family protein [Collibacillus ludicampi]GIM46479.1 N-acylneuraminate-9-phosphate synthase [Collibacillus ludicampi]